MSDSEDAEQSVGSAGRVMTSQERKQQVEICVKLQDLRVNKSVYPLFLGTSMG